MADDRPDGNDSGKDVDEVGKDDDAILFVQVVVVGTSERATTDDIVALPVEATLPGAEVAFFASFL